MPAFFVTATGTDIGKTFVTAGLLRHLRKQGEAASALKPVVSGYSTDATAGSDPSVLLGAMGVAVSEESVADISPWRFAAPLSPDMAAARENRTIDFGELVDFCRKRIAAAKATLFVEGVGGVLVPLDDRHTVADWMAALGLPVIVVTGSYLGTISHTLTALEAIARRGLTCAALVLNQSADSTVCLEGTVATLGKFADGVPIVVLRRGAPVLEQDLTDLWQVVCHRK